MSNIFIAGLFFTVDENYLHVLLRYPLPAGMAVDIVHTFPKHGAKRERAVSEFRLLAL
jgi:hypothetical protein